MSEILPTQYRRGRPPKWPKYTHVHPTKSAAAPTAVSAVPQTHSTNSVSQFSSSNTGDLASKTVIKGNIIYKRTETGEVIASVIKNGPKPVASTSVPASTSRGRQSSDTRISASAYVAGEISLPTDCPVNEENVERVLDESVTATQSMRRTLVSLKDDLRRMGGGAAMSPSLKPIHLQHRINIAYKLARAFSDYRSTISAISGAGRSAGSAVTCSEASRPTDATPITTRVANSAPETCSSQHITTVTSETSSRQTVARATSETVIEQASTDVTDVVSDDLCISCEAGQD